MTLGFYKVHRFTTVGNSNFVVSSAPPGAAVEYLVVAGGGGGGYSWGGGGGAGGYRSSVQGEMSGGGQSAETPFVITAGSYSVTVGAGGDGRTSAGQGFSGQNSSFASIVSAGGGGGGNGGNNGLTGGSGGGGSYGEGVTRSAGAGTAGQGFIGGFLALNQTSFGGGGAGTDPTAPDTRKYRYFRYITRAATISHHPRYSRLMLTLDGEDVVIHQPGTDNCNDSSGSFDGDGGIRFFDATTPKSVSAAKIYSVFTGGDRAAHYSVQASTDNAAWVTVFNGLMRSNSQCGIIEGSRYPQRGGDGVLSNVLGFSQYYAGGGSGASFIGGVSNTLGGQGGGGSTLLGRPATSGQPNTGGGGGAWTGVGNSAAGGSGIVIVRYPSGTLNEPAGVIQATGGTIDYIFDGASIYKVHRFTTAGTFTFTVANVGNFKQKLKFSTSLNSTFNAVSNYRGVVTPTTQAYTIVVGSGGFVDVSYPINLLPNNIRSGKFASGFVPIQATGGTESTITVGGKSYRLHQFTNVGSSSFIVSDSGTDKKIDYLIIGGGGGGGNRHAGGGGAGGMLEGSLTISDQNYPIFVGAGGNGATSTNLYGTKGSNSSGFGITAIGGGAGVSDTAPNNTTKNGGSGGGGAYSSSLSPTGGTGITGQGNNGGSMSGSSLGGAGGGGAGGAGTGQGSGSNGGQGGAAKSSSITGISVFYAGGGGGGSAPGGGTPGLGGGTSTISQKGGAGDGFTNQTGGPGIANTGGGGGGTGNTFNGGPGGSGVVIIRYPLEP
jgi:hypothetical protein